MNQQWTLHYGYLDASDIARGQKRPYHIDVIEFHSLEAALIHYPAFSWWEVISPSLQVVLSSSRGFDPATCPAPSFCARQILNARFHGLFPEVEWEENIDYISHDDGETWEPAVLGNDAPVPFRSNDKKSIRPGVVKYLTLSPSADSAHPAHVHIRHSSGSAFVPLSSLRLEPVLKGQYSLKIGHRTYAICTAVEADQARALGVVCRRVDREIDNGLRKAWKPGAILIQKKDNERQTVRGYVRGNLGMDKRTINVAGYNGTYTYQKTAWILSHIPTGLAVASFDQRNHTERTADELRASIPGFTDGDPGLLITGEMKDRISAIVFGESPESGATISPDDNINDRTIEEKERGKEMAKPQAPAPATPALPALDFSRLVSFKLFADGGGFGPTSFHGYPITADYRLYRFPPADPVPADYKANYVIIFHVHFRVTEILQSEGWDGDEFEYTKWSLGNKSALDYFATNDMQTPAGIDDGLEELRLYASNTSAQVAYETLRMCKEGLDKKDLANTAGRWLVGQKDDAKIQKSSGCYKAMQLTASTIHPVNPEFVYEYEEKEKGEMVPKKILDFTYQPKAGTIPGADGYPLGANLLVGMAGLWDTHTFDLGTIKGKAASQKVLYLSAYDGRYEVNADGDLMTGGASKSSVVVPAASKAAGKATSKPTPAAAAEITPEDTSAAEESEDTETKLKRLLTAHLVKVGKPVPWPNLPQAILTGNFHATEMKGALDSLKQLFADAPDNETAKEWLSIGMVEEPVYIKDGNTLLIYEAAE